MGTHAWYTLIPVEYDNRLVGLSQLLDVIDDAADLLVHKRHRGVVCAALSLEDERRRAGSGCTYAYGHIGAAPWHLPTETKRSSAAASGWVFRKTDGPATFTPSRLVSLTKPSRGFEK